MSSTANAWSAETYAEIRQALSEHAPASAQAEPRLRALIEEQAARAGKLFRARLVLATTDAHGVDRSVGLPLATAVEYFHLASLLLDDLPCMDNAETRRGSRCAHRVYGEATTILGSLAFINRAYNLVGFALATQPGPVRLQAQACVDACLGSAGLLGGQARDLAFADSDGSSREVGRVALGKTGAMLWLGLLLPALLTGPERKEVRAIEALCIYWGLAFQAMDDLRDVLATSVDAGKTTGRDRALSRPNLAVAIGVPRTRERIRRLMRLAERNIARLTQTRPEWAYLAEFQSYFIDAAAPVTTQAAGMAA